MYGARAADNSVKATTNFGRDLEAAVLMRAARELKAVQDHWNDPGRLERLEDALRLNQRVWTIFQVELSSPANPLPQKIRQDILSLAAFIDKRIIEMMASPTPEKLTPIININLNIAAGLQGA
jgi:flagellar biosynthesis activator protein FlaF